MTVANKIASSPSMSGPTVGQKRLVVVGASGMVGSYALHSALESSAVKSVTSIGRKKVGISHPKLKEVVHQNFADCSALTDILSGQDAAVYCLGAYTGSVSDAELHTITADYTIEFARVLHKSSPNAAFSFLSGNGADQTGRSRIAFARYKGEAEKGINRSRFPTYFSFSARVHLSGAAPKGTEPQLPAVAGGVSGVSSAVSEPGNSSRQLGLGDGECCG